MTLTPLELLAIQAEDALDAHGRLAGVYGVTIACTSTDAALWIGADVPEPLAAELAAAFAHAPRAARLDEPPPALDRCGALLGPLSRSAGPTYRIGASAPAAALDVHLEDDVDRLRDANPGNWHPVEWRELLDGTLGPRAIATERDRVVSICHTPGPVTARGAECGVWTHPAHRGRGLAAATVAAWAALVRPSGRHLFYSTTADNLASQRVAQRLHLDLLGWTWRHARPRPDVAVHPLCSLVSGSGRARSS